MSKGNRGFGDSVLGSVAAARPLARSSPAESVLQSRSTSLADLATGKLVTDRTQWVDPAKCRPWKLHNRELEHLSEESCADLIDSIKAEGKQRIPAIVRRLRDDPDYDYEIIAGVRRWWTIGWLRTHNYPDFLYLVTVQTVTDEEGFRLADLENRARKDISDLERARDYLRALELFYDGSQAEMASRLKVSPGWMSRMLEVARLPAAIVEAFPHPHEVTARHAGLLGPHLKKGPTRDRMMARAEELARERAGSGMTPAAHAVVAELLKAVQTTGKAKSKIKPRIHLFASMAKSGKPLIEVEPLEKGRGHVIRLFARTGADKEEVRAALSAMVDELL